MKYGVVIDIETTGFLSYQKRPDGFEELSDNCEILSVGYIRVDLDTNRIFDANVLYFYKPYFKVESDAQRIHHLQRSFLEQFEDKFDENLAMLETILINAVVIGKNSDTFDIPVIEEFLKKHRKSDLTLFGFINTCKMKDYDKKTLYLDNSAISYDVQKNFAPMYRFLMLRAKGVELSGRKKGSLTEYLDLIDENRVAVNGVLEEIHSLTDATFNEVAHDAMYDAAATWVVYKFLIKALKAAGKA